MEFTISMYKGGERVYAKDCDFNSYSELALLCPDCKQEVYLRKGKIIKPYFAHFRDTNLKQATQCKLRVSSDEHAIKASEFIGYRGQKLEIFQQRFISMIYLKEERIVEDIKFSNWIDSIKRNNNQAIHNITKDCIDHFINYQKEIVEIYCVPLKDDQPFLQQQIALKAIDYLCVQSSFRLLEYLLYYSVYKLYEHEQDKLFQQEITTIDIANICQYTAKVIMLNPWIEAINNAKNTQLLANSYQLLKFKIVKNKSLLRLNTDIEAGSISDSEQDAIFWLRRVYLEWSEYHCLTDRQIQDLQQVLTSRMSKVEHENAIARLRNSNKFKSFLTFTCPHQDTKKFDEFMTWVNRLSLSTEAIEDPLDGLVYKISPDWNRQTSIKFTSVLQLMEFSMVGKNVDLEYLEKEYISKTEVLQVPCLLALDLLSGSLLPCPNNQILTSAIHLDTSGVLPFIKIDGKEYSVSSHLSMPNSDRNSISTSVSTRVIGKASRSTPKSTGTAREPKKLDDWMLLSHMLTSTEVAIIAINSPKYRDCTLLFSRFELVTNQFGEYSVPELLENTLQANKGIFVENIIGYVAIRYPNGRIEHVGIVFLHDKKDRETKQIRKQLWYSDIVRYEHKQTNQVISKSVVKFVRDKHGNFQKQEVPVTTMSTAIASVEIKKDPELAIFISLYGLRHQCPIVPAKLTLVGSETKQIAVNWHSLTGLRVAPISKTGQVEYNPKYSCPFTVVSR
ncbi:hypothetical protein [Nostoc sp. JL33]|uniref:competence protein CoiA family protein n=1 Tax=Nostoc sp. JL33 TaxID=2815396 RepID=UPI0025FFC533|nr:hypothetical protein [Nostoc sp. JL33]MBN3874547.1 hypothetical protein [Nostoc sp. JL33]